MEWKNHRLRWWFMNRSPLFYSVVSVVVFLFSAFALLSGTKSGATTNPCLDVIRCQGTSTKADIHIQESETVLEKSNSKEEIIMFEEGKGKISSVSSARTRRLLGGPGSWPPRCMWKCGSCTPCRPVHVAVPPGTPVTTEYYPEAWRCKCGNRLYMP